MEDIKLIIEQYKKRLQTLKNTKGLDMIADTRLKTKASCYRTIVSELERALAKNTPTSEEQLVTPAVSKCVEPVEEGTLIDFFSWLKLKGYLRSNVYAKDIIDLYKSINGC